MRQTSFAGQTLAPVGAPAGVQPQRQARVRVGARRALRFAKDPYRLVLLLLIVLTVSRLHMAIPSLNKTHPLIVLTIAALGVAWARPALLAQRALFATWPAKVVGGIALWALLGMFFGMSFGSTATFITEDFGKTLIFTFLILASIRTSRDLFTVIVAYIASASWLVYQAVFHFHLEMEKGGYYRLSHLDTYDANDLGLVLLLGLSLTLLLFQVARLRGRIITGGVLLGIAAAIAKSGSRGALVGLGAMALASLVLLQAVPLWKRCVFIAVAIMGITVFAPSGYWKQMETIIHPENDYNWDSNHGRRQVAKRGIGYFKMFPVFGLGVGNFERAECTPEISPNARYRYAHGLGVWCEPPHNSYVQALAETGAGGILLWLVMVPGAAVWLVFLRRRMPQQWLHGDGEQRFLYFAPMYLSIGIIAFSVGAFFLTFAWREVTFYIPGVVAGLDAAVAERMAREGIPGPLLPGSIGNVKLASRQVRRWIARPVTWGGPRGARAGRVTRR
ncbi:MAG: O-antigen ligase family protein [Gemmatimonadales bacterium]